MTSEQEAYAELQDAATAFSDAAQRLLDTDPRCSAYRMIRVTVAAVVATILEPTTWPVAVPKLAAASVAAVKAALPGLEHRCTTLPSPPARQP